MKTVELFCGTKSFSKAAKARGWETFTVDIDPKFKPDLVHDIMSITPLRLALKILEADVVWMSPPCQTFSMASGNTHWNADRTPKTQQAKYAKRMLEICDKIAYYLELNNKVYFIENPRARARWFMPVETRHTVWYCQYGHRNAKPTDIWTNLKGWTGKTCKNGNPCHEAAPRGSKTGTQGLKGAMERGVIPLALFEELFNIIEPRDRSRDKPSNST